MRIATIPLQRSTADAIRRSQEALAETQARLSTGKKAPDLAALGNDAARIFSSRSMLAREDAHAAVATRLGTTLSLYDAHIGALDEQGTDLREKLLTAIGTREGAGLTEAIEAAFESVRSALNADEGGLPLFGGGRDGAPFLPEALSDLIGLPPEDAFANGQARASARVADRQDMAYGVLAEELGTGLTKAFALLAEAVPIGARVTDAQAAKLTEAKDALDAALTDVRGINAANGRRMAAAESLAVRAVERALVLRDVIGRTEDADLAEVALDLARHKTMLEASYSVFGQLNSLSLVSWLR